MNPDQRFEFLLGFPDGDFLNQPKLPEDRYDSIMTPDSFEWRKEIISDWPRYYVGEYWYEYSWEMPGIQMTFSESMPLEKAEKIAHEVLAKIFAESGKQLELHVY